MDGIRRRLEEIVLCLLLNQINESQLLYFLDNVINKPYTLSYNNIAYIRKQVMPALINNIANIDQMKIISKDSLNMIIQSFDSLNNYLYQKLSNQNHAWFTLNTFQQYLECILSLQRTLFKKEIIPIYHILRLHIDEIDYIQLFVDSFYSQLDIDNQYNIITSFREFNYPQIIEKFAEVIEANGIPGVVYAPICFKHNMMDLIDKVIEIGTIVESKEISIKKKYISTTTVYDFYIQLMIHHDINIELYSLYYNDSVTIEVSNKDFTKTLEVLLSEYNIKSNTPITFCLKALPRSKYNNIYFDIDNNKLENGIQRLFDIWWQRIQTCYDRFESLENKIIISGLRSEIQERSIVDLIEKKFSNIMLMEKDEVIDVIREQSPCILHFIIGFNYNKKYNSLTPYIRNTMLIILPRYLMARSYLNTPCEKFIKEPIRFFAQKFNDDALLYNSDYQYYFNHWVNSKNCSSAYITNAKEIHLNCLIQKLLNLDKQQSNDRFNLYKQKHDDRINCLSKIILEELTQEPNLLNKLDVQELKTDGKNEFLLKHKYYFTLYYYIACQSNTFNYKQDLLYFSINYLQLPNEISSEVVSIVYMVFEYIKINLIEYFDINLLTKFIELCKTNGNDNKILLLWHLIEIINEIPIKKSLSLTYEDWEQIIPSSLSDDIIAYLHNKNANANGNTNENIIIQYLLFTGAYFPNEMKLNKIQFNQQLKEVYFSRKIANPKILYCIYYYLMSTNQIYYPIASFKPSNINEILLSSILIQLSNLDIFQSTLRQQQSNDKENQLSVLFNEISKMNVISFKDYSCLTEFIQGINMKLDQMILRFLSIQCQNINQMTSCINRNELLTEYNASNDYTSDILIIRNKTVQWTIQDDKYILKGYWIKVSDAIELYYSYCNIYGEWYIYTSDLKKANRNNMRTSSQSDIILIYTKKSQVSEAIPSFLNLNKILLDEMIIKYPFTLIDLGLLNFEFGNFFFKTDKHLAILEKYIKNLQNNKNIIKDRRFKRLCFHLLTNYKFELKTNESFKENIIQQIKFLFSIETNNTIIVSNHTSTTVYDSLYESSLNMY